MHLNENEKINRIKGLRSRRDRYNEFSIHKPKRKSKKEIKPLKLDGEVLSGGVEVKEKRKRTRNVKALVPKSAEDLQLLLEKLGLDPNQI